MCVWISFYGKFYLLKIDKNIVVTERSRLLKRLDINKQTNKLTEKANLNAW